MNYVNSHEYCAHIVEFFSNKMLRNRAMKWPVRMTHSIHIKSNVRIHFLGILPSIVTRCFLKSWQLLSWSRNFCSCWGLLSCDAIRIPPFQTSLLLHLQGEVKWRWRQHGPLKRWYPSTTLNSITTQKTSTAFIFPPPPTREDGGSRPLSI